MLNNSKTTQRYKRAADDAFGTEEENRAVLYPQTLNFNPPPPADVAAAPQVSGTENRLLAQMLGIDFSSSTIEPPAPAPAPYVPDYGWWPREPNKPRTPDSTHTVSPSPKSGSSHSSPAAAMAIPFSFDQTSNFWDAPLLPDLSVNFISGTGV